MAYLIKISKVDEDAFLVKYNFEGGGWDVGSGSGQATVNKASGEVSVSNIHSTEAVDWAKIHARVIWKLSQHWRAKEFPDETSWAS